jgi:hypothetical protein
MSQVIIAGDTSGTITLQAPAVSGSTTLTLPATTGNFLTSTTQLIGTGTTTNNDASAGQVGEYVSSTVSSGSSIALSGSTASNITSISLTAGDWDVSGTVLHTGSGTTSTLNWAMGGVSSNSATLGTSTPGTYSITPLNSGIWTQTESSGQCGPVRFSISTTTTVYLIGRASFTGGTVSVYGQIRARRVR